MRGWRRLLALATATAVATVTLVAVPPLVDSEPEAATAADARDFDPGRIIDDAVFYAPGAMTTEQVQAFLAAKVPTCRAGYTCLKDYRQDTTSQPARPEGCAAIAGRTAETAASIIVRVASACGINPKVMIVLLEKEQGLVSDTWPTARQYRSATGYGCPDTADCDSAYYGFYNQVYNAAWQFKKYRAYPDRAYRAGVLNTILWHPNTTCGSSRVFIANQATAGLYLYTPYRPNAAALANLYGTGDSCSSYGNRNFWRLFTDWFGSTRGSGPFLVKSATAADVYLLSAGVKHPVTKEVYPEYRAVLGGASVVDQGFLDSMPVGRLASLFVKNAKTGEVALIQDGATHGFSSCALVALWGSRCGDGYLTITDEIYRKFVSGPVMTKFATDAAGVTVMIEDSTAYPLVGDASSAFNGGSKPYAARMEPGVLSNYAVGRALAGPHSFIKSESDATVYYVDGRSRIYGLTNWTFATEYGLNRTAVTVADSVLAGYSKSGNIGLLVQCGARLYAASNGSYVSITSGDTGGLGVVPLETETCGLLRKAAGSVTGQLFLKAIGDGEVSVVHDGTLRPLTSVAQMNAQNNGSRPTILNVSATTLAQFPKGDPALRIGEFVRFSDSAEVGLVNGWEIVPIARWTLADEYGLPRAYSVQPPTAMSGYERSSTPVGTFAKCGPTDVFAVTGGVKRGVTKTALAGNPFTRLHPVICASIPTSNRAVTGALFLTNGSAYRVAVAGGFAPISVGAMQEAEASPFPLTVASSSFDVLPARGAAPASGTLIRGSNSSSVYFVDGATKHGLPNWGVAADLGVSGQYSIVHPAEPALLASESPRMSVFVTCGGEAYVASQGVLHRVDSALLSGFVRPTLTTEACAALNLTGAPIARDLYVKDAATGAVYRPSGGNLLAVAAPPASANILVLDSRTINGLPTG